MSSQKHSNSLSLRLIEMGEKDQEARRAFRQTGVFDSSIDEENQRILKGIVEKHGWPTISLVGAQAARAAWLIIQHADLKQQRSCLPEMYEAAKTGEMEKLYFALFLDRLAAFTADKQLFGSQFFFEDGCERSYPLADEAERREIVTKLLGQLDEQFIHRLQQAFNNAEANP